MSTFANILKRSYTLYGSLAIGLTILLGVLGAITTIFSRVVLIQVLQAVVSPVLVRLLGASEATAKVAYLIMLIKFSPLIIFCVLLFGSIIVSIILALPDLCSAYCISNNSEWLPVVMGLSIIKNIAIFPVGTILSILSIVYLAIHFAGKTSKSNTA